MSESVLLMQVYRLHTNRDTAKINLPVPVSLTHLACFLTIFIKIVVGVVEKAVRFYSAIGDYYWLR